MPVKCQACVCACFDVFRWKFVCVSACVWQLCRMTMASFGPARPRPQWLVVKKAMYPRDSATCSAGFPVDSQGLPRSGWSGCQWHSDGFPSPQNARVLARWTQRQPISYQDSPGSPPTASHQQSSQWVFLFFSSNIHCAQKVLRRFLVFFIALHCLGFVLKHIGF